MKIQRLFAFVLAVVLLSSVATALPVTVDSVQVDDIELTPNAVNRLDLERNKEYEVEILLTPLEDLVDVEAELKISGFEYNDVNPIFATSHVEDLDANVTYKFRLPLRLPSDVEEDNYKLRLRLSDRDGDVTDLTYNLKVDVPRHRLVVEDVMFHPGGSVMAGQGMLVTVRLENEGEMEEEDIKVEVRADDLQVSAVDYIDSIDPEDEEETEEMFMRVPLCTKTGTYPVDVIVTFDEGYERTTAKSSVTVLESSNCPDNAVEETTEVVQEQDQTPVAAPEAVEKSSSMRNVLEVVLLVLVALIVIVGLIIGFSKLKGDEDEF